MKEIREQFGRTQSEWRKLLNDFLRWEYCDGEGKLNADDMKAEVATRVIMLQFYLEKLLEEIDKK